MAQDLTAYLEPQGAGAEPLSRFEMLNIDASGSVVFGQPPQLPGGAIERGGGGGGGGGGGRGSDRFHLLPGSMPRNASFRVTEIKMAVDCKVDVAKAQLLLDTIGALKGQPEVANPPNPTPTLLTQTLTLPLTPYLPLTPPLPLPLSLPLPLPLPLLLPLIEGGGLPAAGVAAARVTRGDADAAAAAVHVPGKAVVRST